MSGHNKWSQIKHKKAITDAQKGKVFTKLGNAITIAAREGGGDPVGNFKLKALIDKAHSENMPTENIQRSIKRGTGKLEGVKIEEITYEVFGPSGVALLIKAITDNKNRTVNEIRNLLTKFGGKLATGGVAHLFEQKGVIRIEIGNKDRENIEMTIIDAGADDIQEDDDIINIYTKPQDLFLVKKNLEKAGLTTTSAELTLEPKTMVKINDDATAKKIINLMETLDENSDVSSIYANFDIDDTIMKRK